MRSRRLALGSERAGDYWGSKTEALLALVLAGSLLLDRYPPQADGVAGREGSFLLFVLAGPNAGPHARGLGDRSFAGFRKKGPSVTVPRTLVDSLWDARHSGGSVAAPAGLNLDDGIDVLRSLTDRALGAGRELVGWKLARLPSSGGAEGVVFAAPVFLQSLLPTALAHARAPRLEVELVCTLGDAMATWSELRWNVGMEIIDNHDPRWSTSAGWALADWGLHVGAKLGDSCHAPVEGTAIGVDVQIGDVATHCVGTWSEHWYETMIDALQRDCSRLVRPCAVGDRVWTGALVPAIELVSDTAFNATVHGFGSVSSEDAP